MYTLSCDYYCSYTVLSKCWGVFVFHSAANLQPDAQGFTIPVHGRSLLPYCHFELEESDYVSGGRRNPELRGPGGAPPGSTLDPNTKVIEFKSCGVKVKNIK